MPHKGPRRAGRFNAAGRCKRGIELSGCKVVREGFQRVIDAPDVKCWGRRIVPKDRGAPKTVICLKFLHDSIGSWLKLPHVIRIDQVKKSLFSTADDICRSRYCDRPS